MVDSQLLPQGQVLENETSMSARQDDQEPSNLDNADDHGPSIAAGPAWLRPRLALRGFDEPERTSSRAINRCPFCAPIRTFRSGSARTCAARQDAIE